jgi:hypothetical protein
MKLDHINDLELLNEQVIIKLANEMMEMANLPPADTGLPCVIWLGEVGGQHGPRIKVSNIKGKMSNDCFVVTVSKTPTIVTPRSVKMSTSDVDHVIDWIILNYEVLMQLYQVFETGDGSVVPLFQQLQKI